MLANVFAQRLLLSLRKVDDMGTRAIISSLAFNAVYNDDQGSTDFESHEGGKGNDEGKRSAEVPEGGEVEVNRRRTSNSEA